MTNVFGAPTGNLWEPDPAAPADTITPVNPYKKLKVDEVDATTITGTTSLAGDVTGTTAASVVSTVGGKTAAEVSSSVNDTQAATDSATINTIVKRDASGNASFDAVNAFTVTSAPGFSLNLVSPTFLNLTTGTIVLNPSNGLMSAFNALIFSTASGNLTLKSDVASTIVESGNQIVLRPGGALVDNFKLFSSGVSNFYRNTSTSSQQIINFRSDVDTVDSIQSQILADGSFTGTADLKLNSADTATDYQATTLKFADAYTLTDEGGGTITVSPNAKTVMPVGEMFWAETPAGYAFTANTWTNLTAMSFVGWTFEGHSDWFSLVTTTPNEPRLRWDGTSTEYMHTALSLSASSSAAGVSVEVGLTKNNAGTPDATTIADWDFANNNSFASYAFHKVFALAGSDDLSIMIRTSANVTLTFSNINFVIVAACMRQSTDP